jgi:hypothetical protein
VNDLNDEMMTVNVDKISGRWWCQDGYNTPSVGHGGSHCYLLIGFDNVGMFQVFGFL